MSKIVNEPKIKNKIIVKVREQVVRQVIVEGQQVVVKVVK